MNMAEREATATMPSGGLAGAHALIADLRRELHGLRQENAELRGLKREVAELRRKNRAAEKDLAEANALIDLEKKSLHWRVGGDG